MSFPLAVSAIPFLRLDQVTRYYHSPRFPWGKPVSAQVVFHNLSLDLQRHERVGLVGASGCGKSTLLKTLLALESPQAGALYCDGNPIKPGSVRSLREYRRLVQYLPQDPAGSLAPHQRVADLLAEPLNRLCGGKSLPTRLREAMEQVELSSTLLERKAGQLSGGQAQRVALARALIIKPAYLLADEPMSGLDLPLREQMNALLRHISEENRMGLLMVSHDISMLAGLCERMLVMENGRLIEDRPTAEVLRSPQQPHTYQLLQAVPGLALPRY